MKRERGIVFAGLLLAFVLVTIVARRLSEPGAGNITPATERKPMPLLSTTDLGGHAWTIAQHRGQVVLINYWATWCGPCIEEEPGLVRVAGELDQGDFALLGVSLDAGGDTQANRAKVDAFVHRFHVGYPIAFPPAGSQMEFGLAGIPTTVLVDRQGRVAKLYEGAVRGQVFKADIETLLHEP